MKILVTGVTGESIPPPYAGIPKHSLLLARLWREKGHQVAVSFVYHHSHEDDLGAQGTYFFEYGKKPGKLRKVIFLARYALQNPALFTQLLVAGYRAEGVITRELVISAAYGVFVDTILTSFAPDVIVAETALVKSFMISLVAKKRGVPLAIHTYAEIHDITMSPNKRLIKDRPRMRSYWTDFLNRADLILAPSHYCAKGPLAYVPADKVKMLYFGIDIQPYLSSTTTQHEARERFGVPHNAFAAIAVGALNSRKGHDHLIKAAGILARKGKPIDVVICGPGDQAPFKKLAEEEGIVQRVHFYTGLSEEDLIALYHTADVYCDASNTVRACLGMSLTEGMILGLPAVAYDSGGMPEVVLNNENGYVVPTNDTEKLAEALDKVRTLSPEARSAMGARSKQIAEEAVDIEKEAVRILDLLKTIGSRE